MNEPSLRTSRLAIAAALVALVGIGGGGFFLGRTTTHVPEAPLPAAAPLPTPAATSAPVSDQLLGRADLIKLGEAAADAAASELPMPEAIEAASGRRFRLFLPFGCHGPAAPDSNAPLRWQLDKESSTLRLHVAPTTWTVADWWQAPPVGLEALEGFWIARPWSSRETCGRSEAAAAPDGIDAITLPGQSLGIVELVGAETPRQFRRGGKPYESTLRVETETLALDMGLRVRLEGRVARFPKGKAVRCIQPGGSAQRPVCLIAASIEEVAIENPASQEVLATWAPTAANVPHPGRDR